MAFSGESLNPSDVFFLVLPYSVLQLMIVILQNLQY